MTVGVGSRRAYGTALALLAAGGGLLLVAFGMTWGTVDVPLLADSDAALRSVTLTGRDVYPGAAASGWLALAAVAGIVATRSWGRSAVAVVAAAAGLVGMWAALAFVADPAAAAATGGSMVETAASDSVAVGVGWIPALAGGAMVAVSAAWVVARGRGWPTLGSRYQRRSRADRQVSAWDAQDMGRDPTDDLVE